MKAVVEISDLTLRNKIKPLVEEEVRKEIQVFEKELGNLFQKTIQLEDRIKILED